MKTTLVLLSAVAISTASAFVPAIDESTVHAINSDPSSTWTAHMSPRFHEHSMENVQHLCGTIIDPEVMRHLPDRDLVHPDEALSGFSSQDIPEEFDSRTGFPECASVIGHVRDQANCGSCWAFASTEAFNDRLCIASKGKFTTLLSPMDTVNCCGFFKCASMGCNGGQPAMAWKFFKTNGVVTGGDYQDIDSGSTCLPYKFESCSHHVEDPYRSDCSKTKAGFAQGCRKTCDEATYATSYTNDKYYVDSAYSLRFGGVAGIQRDIMTYGPVSAAFIVYGDFPAYKSGVYSYTKGQQLGGHAVKIIGWGVEDGVEYWTIMNSWNEMWGDNGTFKIRRGVNECGIESMGVNGGRVTYRGKN